MLKITVSKDNSNDNYDDPYPIEFTLHHKYNGSVEDIKVVLKQICMGLTYTEDTIKDIFNEEY